MNLDSSFNQQLDKAVKHYSSLFKLPSHRRILTFLWLLCQFIGMLQVLPMNPTLQGLVYGLALGASLFAATVLSNFLLRLFVLKRDPVYDLRRIAALSLFSWIFWFPFILMGALVAVISPQWAVRLYILGFSAALILRFIALYVTSSSGVKSLFAASVLPPFLYVAPFFPFWLDVTGFVKLFLSLLCALVAALCSSFLFTAILNGVGRKVVGFPSLSILKAFLLNWVADLNEPFEYFLDVLGEERDVEVSILRFDKEKGSIFIVVPSVHPGPFKNVGSSLLPSMLKDSLERSLESVACVLLGLLGHEFDLASQRECQKIIDHVVKSATFTADGVRATPSIAVKNDMATVCCQAFEKTVLASFSLAPHTTEDLPPELGLFVQEKAWKLGFKDCVFVNAHNSIDGVPDLNRALASLETSASACLEKISSLDGLPFKVGAAVVKPKEFSLSEGMGLGGITAVVVEVEGQKNAYVVFDGNNMVSGLREKILSVLHSVGVSGGEVFTTDTHSVNAVTLTVRGYHPIGEVMDHERVIEYVKEAVSAAIADLSPAKVGFHRIKVQKVKVIGREALEKLCTLPDMVTRRAKLTVVPLFIATFLFLMLILLLV